MSVQRRKNIVLAVFMICAAAICLRHPMIQGRPDSQTRTSTARVTRQDKPSLFRPHPYGGTLVIGAKYKPTIINPVFTTHTISLDVMNIIFNKIIRFGVDGSIEPDLAERWDISEDRCEYTFYLKRGVRFHDDVELTAEDVKYTLQQYMDPENNSPYRYHFDFIEGIEIVDRYVLRVRLAKPLNSFLFELADREVIPKHILEGKDLRTTSFNYRPVGTGPFKFESWNRKTDRITLVANNEYFEGRPYLDRIVVHVYPNKQALWAAFMRQEVDLVSFLDFDDYETIKADPAFKAYAVPWNKYYALLFNQKDAIWHDRELRKAVAQSIDIKKMMDAIHGYGLISTGPFHPDSMGFNTGVRRLAHDPEKAKMLLMHRGWLDVSVDDIPMRYGGADVHGKEHGIRYKGGRELELRVLLKNNDPNVTEMVKFIRQDLSEVGIRVRIILYNTEDDFTEEFLAQNRPQAWLRLFSGQGQDPDECLGSWYSLVEDPHDMWNYRNETVDHLVTLAKSEQDQHQRSEIYQHIHREIYDDQPACFLYYPFYYHAMSNLFENTDEYFSTHMPFYTLKDWYQHPDSRTN